MDHRALTYAKKLTGTQRRLPPHEKDLMTPCSLHSIGLKQNAGHIYYYTNLYTSIGLQLEIG